MDVCVHTFKHEYLHNKETDRNQILPVTSLEKGKGCIKFGIRLDQKSGFYGTRELQWGYSGENRVKVIEKQLTGTGAIKRHLKPKREINKYYK